MRTLIISFLLLFSLHVTAQNKRVPYQQQTWLGYNPQIKLSKHWGLWFDSEIHTTDHYFNGFSQAAFRVAGTYYNNKNNKFTGGYGYTDYFPGENHAYISIPEHFAWEQYQWFRRTKKTKLMQWLRLEEKFKKNVTDNYTAADDYTLLYKARYNIFYLKSLSRKGMVPKALAVALGDELYLYYGPHVNNHLFDQNRVFIGFSYLVNSHDNLQFGIMSMLQEDLSGQYKGTNVLRLSFFQNIDLGKWKSTE